MAGPSVRTSATSGPRAGRSATPEIDQSAFAEAYRHRPLSEPARRRALRVLWASSAGAGDRGLDAGGGTGAQAAVWREHGVEAVVLDASAEMARRALHRGVPSVEARSQRMPFEEGSFRFCQFHLSIHHEGWRRSVAEAARVVAPGGVVGVWTFGHDYLRASFLSKWFPSAARIDVERFPAVEEVAAELRAAGLAVEGPAWEVEERVWPAGDWEQAVRDGFISTLHLLEPEEVRLGLEAFRRAHPDPGERVAYDLPFVWVAGRRR